MDLQTVVLILVGFLIGFALVWSRAKLDVDHPGESHPRERRTIRGMLSLLITGGCCGVLFVGGSVACLGATGVGVSLAEGVISDTMLQFWVDIFVALYGGIISGVVGGLIVVFIGEFCFSKVPKPPKR